METKIINPVNSLEELYENHELYSSQDMFSPPAERLGHVIRFELTTGCSWGGCTYCNGYDGIKPKTKNLSEYEQHVNTIFEKIGRGTRLAESLKRVFIGGGNALSADPYLLSYAIKHTETMFRRNTGEYPKRIAIYGRTDNIIEKGSSELQDLGENGLSLIYWGVESGSSNVLKYINKGYGKEELYRAAEIMSDTPIVMTSVMIMPGLGGIKYYDEHINETARVLGEIRPNFLTFMGINPAPNSLYAKIMQEEQEKNENRPLTDQEQSGQIIEIIDRMPSFETKVGCFDKKIDAVGHNTLTFIKKIEDYSDKTRLVDALCKLKRNLETTERGKN